MVLKAIQSRAGICALLLCAAWGCNRSEPVGDRDPAFFSACVADLTNISKLAETPRGRMLMESSYERTGGNQDGHAILGIPNNEYYLLADIRGSGCLRRMWFTGVLYEQEMEFFFDGETTPRVAKNFLQLKGNDASPYGPPLSWAPCAGSISYIPMPFQKRLIVKTKKTSEVRQTFFQLNYDLLPKGTVTNSFDPSMLTSAGAAIAEVAGAWDANQTQTMIRAGNCGYALEASSLAAGEKKTLLTTEGPAVADELRIVLDWPRDLRIVDRNNLLRQTILRIYWDGTSEPSVEAPLGDFFCNGVRPRTFNSLLISVCTNEYVCRFPMPFRQGMRVEVENGSGVTLAVKAGAKVRRLPAWPDNLNYFHAGWNQSASNGLPHEILDFRGAGHYAGTYLVSQGWDGSWMIFEGDERIYKDDELFPSLHGTGMEDYFNAAWYHYDGIFTTPLAGALEKSGVRSTQYRFHLPDPIEFSTRLRMNIEFGQENAARGYMSSVAYWYSRTPSPVPFRIPAAPARLVPLDPLEKSSHLLECFERERINEVAEAEDLCREYQEKYPGTAEAELFGLRALAYRERREGYDAVRSEYERVAREATNSEVRTQAEMIGQFHASATNAILVAHISAAYKLYLDGTLLLQGDHPREARAVLVPAVPGRHVLAVEATGRRPDVWVSANWIGHSTNFWTDASWKVTDSVQAGWKDLGGETGALWMPSDEGGPLPRMQWYQFVPNPWVFAQYRKQLLGRREGWSVGQTVYFRKEFELK